MPPCVNIQQVKGLTEYAADARSFLTAPATRKGLTFGAVAFLGATFAIALYRVYLKSNSVEAQRRRTVGVAACLLMCLPCPAGTVSAGSGQCAVWCSWWCSWWCSCCWCGFAAGM